MRINPLHLCAVVGGVIALTLGAGAFFGRAPDKTTVTEVFSKPLRPGDVVILPKVGVFKHLAASLPTRRAADGTELHYRAAVLADSEDSPYRLPVIYRRDFSEEAWEDGSLLRMPADYPWKGTLRRLDDQDREAITSGLEPLLGSSTPRLYLADLEFPSVGFGHILLVLAGVALLGFGLIAILQPRFARPESATGVAPRSGAAAASRQSAPPMANGAGNVECTACHHSFTAYQNTCPRCKKPLATEYLVSASPSLVDFESVAPLVVATLKVTDYQARQPLARPHSAIPYLPFDGFHATGTEDPPHRLVARPIPSLVSAKALQAEMGKRGEEALILGTDQLAEGPFPEPVMALSYDEERIICEVADAGGGLAERSIPWKDVGLVLFSADRPLRSSVTVLQSARKGEAVDPRQMTSYVVDLFAKGDPNGLRISEPGHVRWEVEELRAAKPEQRLGTLMEVIEERASDALLEYISGAYRGEHTAWRMSFYSRWRYLVAEHLGWEREDEVMGFPDYEIIELLGKGGMGAVYKAKQVRLGRLVALKVISPGMAASRDFIQRFKLEARAAASLTHPNVVAIIDQGEYKGRHFISMEFVAGETLKTLLKIERRLPEPESLRIALAVAQALEHAHAKAILHRDVKPDNVFMSKDGSVKLGDWGLAKALETDSSLTRTGIAVGTPHYMSPEQAKASKDIGPASDVYSLAAMLYHLLAGRPPFVAESPAEVMLAQVSKQAEDPRKYSPHVQAATAELILAMLDKDPAQRPVTTQVVTRLTELAASATAPVAAVSNAEANPLG